MQKIPLVVIVLILVIALCACGGGESATASEATTSPAQAEAPSQSSSNVATEQTDESGEGGGDLITDEEGGGDLIVDAGDSFSLTLYADFSGGSIEENIQTEDISLPSEDEPASPSLIAFALADGLSEWTGLDFSLNDVTFGEDSITVDWSAESTLIAGLDDRDWKGDFIFYDAVSLNWFMMDSLATTLKNGNLGVETVYYCSDGGPVTFPNPEDMADVGLPELPPDQAYEGSAFFVTHAGTQG